MSKILIALAVIAALYLCGCDMHSSSKTTYANEAIHGTVIYTTIANTSVMDIVKINVDGQEYLCNSRGGIIPVGKPK